MNWSPPYFYEGLYEDEQKERARVFRDHLTALSAPPVLMYRPDMIDGAMFPLTPGESIPIKGLPENTPLQQVLVQMREQAACIRRDAAKQHSAILQNTLSGIAAGYFRR